MSTENNEIMYGAASFAEQKQAASNIINMCQSGNFKLGALLEALKVLHLHGLADRVFKSYINKFINHKLCWNRPLCRTVESMMKSLHDFKLKQPKTFKQLVDIASNTGNFNDTAFKVFIFIICHCADAVELMITNTLKPSVIYKEVIDMVPLTGRVVINTITRAVSVHQLLKQADDYVKKTAHGIVQKLKSIVDTVPVEGIMNISIEPIKRMINSADPFGIAIPIATYVCYDIIVKRVNKNKIKIPWPLLCRVAIVLGFILIVALIVRGVMSVVKKERFYENTSTQDIVFYNDERWRTMYRT
jgi:hypothetical protein